jgi:predicted transcriptional regulator
MLIQFCHTLENLLTSFTVFSSNFYFSFSVVDCTGEICFYRRFSPGEHKDTEISSARNAVEWGDQMIAHFKAKSQGDFFQQKTFNGQMEMSKFGKLIRFS